MADKRMFSKKVIGSDGFMSMPFSAQALYFQLCMSADDEGFLNNAKSVQRMMGASDADMATLLRERFVIGFESGVVLIRHWKTSNYIAKDRFKPSGFAKEKELVFVDGEKAYALREAPGEEAAEAPYTDCIQDVDSLYTDCIQNVDGLYTGCIQNVDEVYTGEGEAAENCTETDGESCEVCRFPVYKPYTQYRLDKNSNHDDDDNGYSLSLKEQGNDRSRTYLREREGNERSTEQEDASVQSQGGRTVAGYCEDCGIFLSPMHYEEIRDFYERGMGDEAMCYAVDKTIGNGVRSWSYARQIIERWCESGIRTLAAAKADTAAFNGRRGKASAQSPPAQKKYDGLDLEAFMSGGARSG